MPVAPSKLEFLDAAEGDLEDLARRDAEAAERVFKKIEDWERMIEWGRVPQDNLKYLKDSPPGHNFYRQWVGRSGHRVIYRIQGGEMLVVAVLPKDDDTYDMDELIRRVSQGGIQ